MGKILMKRSQLAARDRIDNQCLLFNRRIQEILPQRVAEWKKTPSVADLKAEETLKELSKKKQVLLNLFCLVFKL